jgi:hypothetical protein
MLQSRKAGRLVVARRFNGEEAKEESAVSVPPN